MRTKLTAVIITLLLPAMALAQTITLKGTVTSALDGYGVPGASVLIEGTGEGAATDIDGNFTIQTTRKTGTLRISYIGAKTEYRKFSGTSTFNVVLDDAGQEMDEVVVVGYGVMKKSDLTGSVAVVNTDQMKKVPATTIDQALQGRAAGVTVNMNSGQPGGGATVRIRGIGTLTDSNPIYVVDGVITDNIAFLSPNDIASMEVLKDASSTAIYGSRGANGVILVTTKSGSGEKGHSEITYDGYFGWQSATKTLDVMGAKDFLDTKLRMTGIPRSTYKYYMENGMNAYINRYLTAASEYFPAVKGWKKDDPEAGFDYSAIDTDWQNEVFRSGALMQNHHVSINGSTDKSDYSFSGSYYDQEGTVIGSDYQRYTVRANSSFKVNDWLKIGENATYMYSQGRSVMNNSSSPGASIFSAALAMAPWDPPYYPDGAITRKDKDLSGEISASSNFKNVTNPFSQVDHSHPRNVHERFITNLFAEISPLKGLTYRADVSADMTWDRTRSYQDNYEHSSYDFATGNRDGVSAGMYRYSSVIWNNILTYANRIGDHNFSIMAGHTGEEYNMYGLSGSGNYVNGGDNENHWYLGQTQQDTRLVGDEVSRSRRTSWLGRLFYSYKDRYLATVNFRADGTNKFPENKWGYFPSLALGWRMNEESFMKQFPALDNLKLRLGWGRIGNDKIPNNSFNQTMMTAAPTFVSYVLGTPQALTGGATVITWANQGGKWELTETWNAGVDFSFWNGLLSGSVEGFIRDTKDMLLVVKGPAWIGNLYDAQANVGTVRNQGIEIQLGHSNRIGKNFSYSIDGNISFIKNELTALNGGEAVRDGDGIRVSDEKYPLYTFFGYKYKGVYQTQEEADAAMWGYEANPYKAGDAIFEDISGPDGTPDGKIDEYDKTDIGNPFPKVTFGLNLSAAYRDFDLTLFFAGQTGNKIYNDLRRRLEGSGTNFALASYMGEAWHNIYDADFNIAGQEGTIPNPSNSVNEAISDRFVENGSFFRLKNIQLGYSLPKSVLKTLHIQRLRVYASCSNLFTVTKYKGYDPEIGSGVDYGNYPQARTFLVGAQLAF